jgi:predicted N-acyltransferase
MAELKKRREEHPDKTTEPAMDIVIKRSIHDIEPHLWDSVNASHGFFRTHRFFSALESSAVEDAEYWYLALFEQGKPVATAVLSAFRVSLDLLLPSGARRVCEVARKVYPSFLRPRMLFCGVPVSIGKHTISCCKGTDPERIICEISNRMEQIAQDHRIRYLCFKEFVETEFPAITKLRERGYIHGHSIPTMRLPIRWKSFSAYVQSMRHHYRRKVRLSLHKLGITDDSSPLSPTAPPDNRFPRLVLRDFDHDSAGSLYELYREVMKRAETRLELLNRKFFERAAEYLPDNMVLLCLEDEKGIRGAALLGRNEPWLHFLFVGFDYVFRDRYQTYFNLLNGIIAFAIEQGFEVIDLGQTTYEIKNRLGAHAEPVHFYLRSRSAPTHTILSRLSRFLFPPTKIRVNRVFR